MIINIIKQFEKQSKKLVLQGSSWYPNISKQITALGRSGLMLSFVSRYLDTAIKPLHLFFYILHTEDNRRQYTFHNHFRMAHCYLSRCNPPIKKTKRKKIFLKEEHFIVWISKLCPVDPKILFIQFLPWHYKTVNISK